MLRHCVKSDTPGDLCFGRSTGEGEQNVKVSGPRRALGKVPWRGQGSNASNKTSRQWRHPSTPWARECEKLKQLSWDDTSSG
jgi:hypothetical protein